jgi:hypothetical protein
MFVPGLPVPPRLESNVVAAPVVAPDGRTVYSATEKGDRRVPPWATGTLAPLPGHSGA